MSAVLPGQVRRWNSDTTGTAFLVLAVSDGFVTYDKFDGKPAFESFVEKVEADSTVIIEPQPPVDTPEVGQWRRFADGSSSTPFEIVALTAAYRYTDNGGGPYYMDLSALLARTVPCESPEAFDVDRAGVSIPEQVTTIIANGKTYKLEVE